MYIGRIDKRLNVWYNVSKSESFEEADEEKIIDDLTRKGVLTVFNRHFQFDELEPVAKQFNSGFSVETSDTMSARNYVRYLKEIPGLAKTVKKMTDSEAPEMVASIVEFIFEGMHLNKRLNKTRVEGKTIYRH